MISIIISSHQKEFLNSLIRNVENSIGSDIIYEFIIITNNNEYSISEAYNIGVRKSKYDVLLFIHEDIIFNSDNWGNILIEYTNNEKNGIIGVAGNNYLPNVPLGWSGLSECNYINLIQSDKEKSFFRDYKLTEDVEAKSLDGVFLCCRKNVYSKYLFEERIEGFHCYDFIFSNRVSNNYTNIITSKIKITHFSKGNRDINWLNALIQSRDFYEIKNQKNNFRLELKAYYYYGLRLCDYRINFKKILKELLKYLNVRKASFLIYLIFYLIIYELFKMVLSDVKR